MGSYNAEYELVFNGTVAQLGEGSSTSLVAGGCCNLIFLLKICSERGKALKGEPAAAG
ncbi:hypothetical protein M569_15047 [Genlisea aurea]|uniref:Uncharacterized protein n=1 Tax=Genlisea aurea TaxID=192259 RepID=S8DAN2_9LAMI|nr:hypothetical protein M569_15047 [Genlisea aurea]